MGSVSIKSVLSLAFAFGLASSALTASAAPTAKAVQVGNTITFYYDELPHDENPGAVVSTIPVAGTRTWLKPSGDDNTIVNVIFDASFKAFKPLSMASWFQYYRSLTNVTGLENVDTSEVKSMGSLFRCKSGNNGNIKTLDLSTWDTSKCTDMSYMFARLSGVTTIYVSDKFVTSQVTSSDNMFDRCNSLKGGKGTKYVDGVTPKNVTYARIDGGSESPGYFTTNERAPVITSVAASSFTHESVTIEVKGDSLNDGLLTVELIPEVGDSLSKSADDFGRFDFAGLTSETEYLVKVTAESVYGTTIDETCSFTTPVKPADEWSYVVDEATGNGTIGWGEWAFKASVIGETHNLSVGACTGWPTVISPLNFGCKVVGKESGDEYTIVSLSPAFGGLKSGDLVGKEQGGFVGALTLPPAVTNIGAYAFGYCTNATGVVNLPSTLTTLGDYAFAKSGLTFRGADFASLEKVPAYCFKDTKVSGEANLANATSVTKGAFENVSSLRSMKFGPKLTSLYGDYNHGAFHGCSSLTNVTFDADSCFRISGDNVFAACAALKKIDLCGVTSMTVSRTGDYKGSHFKGCNNLAEIDFGPALTNLDKSAVSIDSATLQKVVFEGKVPDVFGTPYLWGTGQTNVLIKTYIHSSMRSKKNAAGKCWRDYAANGEIFAPKKDSSKNTTFAVDYIEVDLDGSAAKRQLLTLEPDSGLILFVK